MKKQDLKNLGVGSKVIHVGGEPEETTGAVIPPIFQTSTYVQKSPGVHKGYEYTRSHNPTRTRLEECLASLENANHALVTASGLSATMLVMHALGQGKKVLSGDDVYGGSYRLFTTVFNEFHKFKFTDTTDLKALKKVLEEFKPDLLWLESPTNPLMKITDIKAACELAKKTKTKVLVDNTFMSPIFQNPLDLGADLVLHSMSKYINGHSDVIGGAIMTNNKSFHQKLWVLQNSIGPSQSPFDSWLITRGLKTLKIRMKAHEENAMEIAKWLEKHPQVEKVFYPGLKSHPQHKIAKKQMSGYGGMMSFIIKGKLKQAKKFLSTVQMFALAESLGGVESLSEHPAIMTHASIPKKVRDELGISDTLIRISVGIEDVDDLKNDLERGFSKACR